jgi:hypothetical protein
MAPSIRYTFSHGSARSGRSPWRTMGAITDGSSSHGTSVLRHNDMK